MSSPSKVTLKRFTTNPCSGQKVLVVVLDGVGLTNPGANLTRAVFNKTGALPDHAFHTGNAVGAAYTPHLETCYSAGLFRGLAAHGPSVGLPSKEDMGNSEVGHNALGAGRVFDQGAKLVNAAIESGRLFEGSGWAQTVRRPELCGPTASLNNLPPTNSLHICGLLSDGNVHSHIKHLFALITGAQKEGVQRVRLHVLLDGRDVSPTSALEYVAQLEEFIASVASPQFDCAVASGGGRTFVTMDRYESDWRIVERGYKAHVLGEGRAFGSLRTAVETLRAETKLNDQDLLPFVIEKNGKPLGPVENGDSFIFFNFRGDRAIEITRALTEVHFTAFVRTRFPQVHYAGMMQYDGDLKLPSVYLVEPPVIENTMGELLSNTQVKQFACSETQKFGHVTYFWNGNRSGKFNEHLEHYVEIPSDLFPFDSRPWMKSAEIADETIAQMKAGSFQVGRINFANGDMVGHTGNFAAAVVSMSSVDLAVGRLMEAAQETNTILVITADHGNADEMYELDKKTGKILFDSAGKPKLKTSHTLAPVPIVIYNAQFEGVELSLRTDLPAAGLANIAATVLELAGFEPPPLYEPSLLQWLKINPTDLPGQETAPKSSSGLAQQLGIPPTSFGPRFALAKNALGFFDTVARLRAPDGCPWDKEQTFASLRPYLIEESYEASAAAQKLAEGKPEGAAEFCDELGDVLLQVYLNAQIASETKLFDAAAVYAGINEKMIRRHPHVFAPQTAQATTAGEVVSQWDKIKATENAGNPEKRTSLLKKALKKQALPTLEYATEVSKRSYRIGFAWKDLPNTFNDLVLEVEELREELFAPEPHWQRIADEAGDVVYALSNIMTFIRENHEHTDAHFSLDLAARAAVQKFITRFQEMELILAEQGHLVTEESAKSLSLDTWNTLWQQAKKRKYR